MIIKYIISITAIAIIYSFSRSYPAFARIISGIFSSFLAGLLILLFANMTLKFIGMSVPINIASILVTGFLGIPGAGALIVLCCIFK